MRLTRSRRNNWIGGGSAGVMAWRKRETLNAYKADTAETDGTHCLYDLGVSKMQPCQYRIWPYPYSFNLSPLGSSNTD